MNARQLRQRFMLHLDPILLAGLGGFMLLSLILLFSASDGSWMRILAQLANIGVGLVALWVVANMPLHWLMRIAVPMYVAGMVLLVGVALFGEISHGARRWIDLGVATIQPSELMKIAVPLMMAWYFEKNEATLRLRNFVVAVILLLLPVGLILRQPDLGTSILIAASGFYVLFLAGLSWRVMLAAALAAVASAPFLWSSLHEYQRHRILMLFDPEQDALGKGYHSIQSMIAIGSGGVLGKGFMNGT
ncbi:MAG: FtsW/RodA/SpoVE family cell cycle protein, partial [Pseudomonadota bacterium]